MTVPNSFISHSQVLGMKPEKYTKFARPWPLVSGDFKSRDLFSLQRISYTGFPSHYIASRSTRGCLLCLVGGSSLIIIYMLNALASNVQ